MRLPSRVVRFTSSCSVAMAEKEDFRCPKCRVEMKSRRIRRVLVEVCPECHGIFLDQGELELLRHSLGEPC